MLSLSKSALFLAIVATASSAAAFSPGFAAKTAAPHGTSSLKVAADVEDTLSESASASSPFDLTDYLVSHLGPIEAALKASVQSTIPQTNKICESMEYSLMAGGKRIRPVLCIAACEMFGGTPDLAMPTAVALEMIHTMSLIHDDLPSMDNDDLRRGKPTNHVKYGEDVAILAGDALLAESFVHVIENTPSSVGVNRVLEIITLLGKSVGPVGLAGGQCRDLECEGRGPDDDAVTLEDLRWIHTHKTAALLQVAVAGGAILGGATKEEVKACEKFALNVGLAFQVADDILDVTASTEDLGKTAAKDLDADKTTFPKLLGLEESKVEAARLISEAKESLEPFGEKARPLLAIADYVIERKN